MPFPYEDLESTPLWEVLGRAIEDLVGNQDLEITTDRRYVVGYLARRLREAGFGRPGEEGAEEMGRAGVLSSAAKG